jgi:hypothetical protein
MEQDIEADYFKIKQELIPDNCIKPSSAENKGGNGNED